MPAVLIAFGDSVAILANLPRDDVTCEAVM